MVRSKVALGTAISLRGTSGITHVAVCRRSRGRAYDHQVSAVAITALGCAAILLFDAGASVASRRFGISYGSFTAGSLIVYATTGFFAAKAGEFWLLGSVAGAAVGAAEARVGWRISRRAGADRTSVSQGIEMWVSSTVTILAAVVGGLAGLLART